MLAGLRKQFQMCSSYRFIVRATPQLVESRLRLLATPGAHEVGPRVLITAFWFVISALLAVEWICSPVGAPFSASGGVLVGDLVGSMGTMRAILTSMAPYCWPEPTCEDHLSHGRFCMTTATAKASQNAPRDSVRSAPLWSPAP